MESSEDLLFLSGHMYTQVLPKQILIKELKDIFLRKKLHWHIDYLLNNDYAEVINTKKSKMIKCSLNKKTNGTIIIKGFGSTDCNLDCKSHLKYLEN